MGQRVSLLRAVDDDNLGVVGIVVGHLKGEVRQHLAALLRAVLQ